MRDSWSLALLVALLATGCATTRAPNLPVDRIDLESGYRPQRILAARTPDRVVAIGRRLLRKSEAFQNLLTQLSQALGAAWSVPDKTTP